MVCLSSVHPVNIQCSRFCQPNCPLSYHMFIKAFESRRDAYMDSLQLFYASFIKPWSFMVAACTMSVTDASHGVLGPEGSGSGGLLYIPRRSCSPQYKWLGCILQFQLGSCTTLASYARFFHQHEHEDGRTHVSRPRPILISEPDEFYSQKNIQTLKGKWRDPSSSSIFTQ